MFENLIYEKQGNVAWLILNRPAVNNAMNDPLRAEIIDALEDARDDSNIHVIAITGSGDKAFCAGGDISEFPNLYPHTQLVRHASVHPILFMRQIHKPVIGTGNGLALGGGCEIVLAADIAIASEKAQFGQPEIKVGLIAGAGGTQVLPRVVGEKMAKELLFTGRTIGAAEALQLGLVNRVVPHEKLREETDNFITELLKNSPIMLQITKLAVNRSMETTLSSGLSSERDLFALCFGTQDQKEGARAFLEKRKPNYKGR